MTVTGYHATLPISFVLFTHHHHHDHHNNNTINDSINNNINSNNSSLSHKLNIGGEKGDAGRSNNEKKMNENEINKTFFLSVIMSYY